jgi:hypothetical protein
MVASESSVAWLGICVGDRGAVLTVWARLLVYGMVGEERSIISCLMWESAMLVWCQRRSGRELYVCECWSGNGRIRQQRKNKREEGTTERARCK